MERDLQFMQQAIALAREGVGLASPNPTVGCVLVREGRIVGRGFHQYELRDHAEIVALKQAGEAARGATAYVTLEPCSHYHRTGPCALALIQAGVARVVAAIVDPNPQVEGRGLRMLREAGIDVATGPLAEEAREINDAFAHAIRFRMPFVTLKIAATLDGAIAPLPESCTRMPYAITGEAAHARVQAMRHASDALLTGIGTVLLDDPRLTDRSGRPRRRKLLRVVLDSHLRMPLDARILAEVDDDLLIVTRSEDGARQRALTERGARILTIDARAAGGISIRPVLEHLAAQDRISVMVEAGSHVNYAVLAADLADRLALFQAQRFLGPQSVPMLAGPAGAALPRLTRTRTEAVGEDLLIEGYMHDPWQA